MKYGLYAIYDSAAAIFTSPTSDISDASAARNFRKMCSDAGSMPNFEPSDFALYRLADYDVETGAITPLAPVVCVVRGADVLRGDNGV